MKPTPDRPPRREPQRQLRQEGLVSRKSRNQRGPSEARKKDDPASPTPPEPREPTEAELATVAAAALGYPLTETEIRNRAEALAKAQGDK